MDKIYKVFLAGLAFDFTKRELFNFFKSKYHSVISVEVVRQKKNKARNKGCGFMQLTNEDEFIAILSQRDYKIGNRGFLVKEYKKGNELRAFKHNLAQRRIFLHNIGRGITNQELRHFFKKIVSIEDAYIINPKKRSDYDPLKRRKGGLGVEDFRYGYLIVSKVEDVEWILEIGRFQIKGCRVIAQRYDPDRSKAYDESVKQFEKNQQKQKRRYECRQRGRNGRGGGYRERGREMHDGASQGPDMRHRAPHPRRQPYGPVQEERDREGCRMHGYGAPHQNRFNNFSNENNYEGSGRYRRQEGNHTCGTQMENQQGLPRPLEKREQRRNNKLQQNLIRQETADRLKAWIASFLMERNSNNNNQQRTNDQLSHQKSLDGQQFNSLSQNEEQNSFNSLEKQQNSPKSRKNNTRSYKSGKRLPKQVANFLSLLQPPCASPSPGSRTAQKYRNEDYEGLLDASQNQNYTLGDIDHFGRTRSRARPVALDLPEGLKDLTKNYLISSKVEVNHFESNIVFRQGKESHK